MNMAQWLIANPGSTSRKYAIYRDGKQTAFIVFRESNQSTAYNIYFDNQGHTGSLENQTLRSAIIELPEIVYRETGIKIAPDAIALRIVACGKKFQQHQWMDKENVSALEKQQDILPLHVPIVLNEFRKLTETFPGIPVLGVSDSAFHALQSPNVTSYGLDTGLSEKYEAKRFGYHGLATASAAAFLANNQAGGHAKTVHAHLGGGTSITALDKGRSIYTSMGWSPLEGPVMMSRSGTLDPALVAVLSENFDSPASFISHLGRECGLKALMGTTDMREIEKQYHNDNTPAVQAIEKYVADVSGYIGTAIMHLEGIDTLIFSGGIGENSSLVRKIILKKLEFLGLKPASDTGKKSSNHQVLTTPDSTIQAIRLKINEEVQMARILDDYYKAKAFDH